MSSLRDAAALLTVGVLAAAGVLVAGSGPAPFRPDGTPRSPVTVCTMLGYSRARFGSEPTSSTRRWVYQQAGTPLVDGYTGQPVARTDTQVDHLVALADAWRSGACNWSDERRHRFAADRDGQTGQRFPAGKRNLVVTLASINEGKSDQGPATWAPANAAARCRYARRYLAVKALWGLTVVPVDASGADADCRP